MGKPVVRLVGILNVTPDSFSDGGRFLGVEAAVAQGIRMAGEGACWVDVGGESTRPGAPSIPAAEEIRRVMPVVERLVAAGIPVSIDTRKTLVAQAALSAGAEVVNDVGGLRAPGMMAAVAQAGAGAVIMHMRGSPADMQQRVSYDDVVEDVAAFLAERLAAARAAGISRLWLDPGIGFAKTVRQNLVLLRRLGELRRLGAPLYVGASRKSFIGAVTGVEDPLDRLGGSIGAALAAAKSGASVLRVHDVAATRQALAVMIAVDGSIGASPGPAE
jgi:dihydropteroate synthase